MDSLEKLLEYQKIDIELRKLIDEIERSDDNKKMEQARNEFNNARDAVNDTERAAESIVAFYNNALAFYEESSRRIDEIGKKMEKSEDLDEMRELAAELEKIRDKMTDVEKKMSAGNDKSAKVLTDYLNGQEKGKKMRNVFNAVKERLMRFKQEKEPQINELKAKLAKIRPEIDKATMETYDKITSERCYPAFAEAQPAEKGKYRCFCGLELSQKAQSELLDKGQCRCETCRRLVYLKK